MIPPIIHQIWIQGYDHIPAELKEYHENCKEVNKKFQHQFWDEIKIKELLLKHFGPEYVELYEYYTVPSQKADLAKYAILYVNGGVYLDMDMVCKRNLESFLKYDLFFTTDVFYILYKRYLTGIIGAKPKHPAFLVVFKNMFLRKPYSYNIQYSAATQLFFDSVTQYKRESGDNNINIIDRKYLHPCSILEDENCHLTCDECYVAHTNYSSWSPSLRFLKFVVKNSKLIALLVIIILIMIFIYLNGKFNWF